ncbi:hypothetical protein [Fontibacter flavus]|uniref:Uncharacterized protein n=1 Tax=Fontibacter flavus TaxID=654838 RepID=A0ABV6FNQ4_9BACT
MKNLIKKSLIVLLFFVSYAGVNRVAADASLELPGRNVCTVSSDPNKNTGKCIGSFAGDVCYHNVMGSHPVCSGNMMTF